MFIASDEWIFCYEAIKRKTKKKNKSPKKFFLVA